jgi:hypothetical protein
MNQENTKPNPSTTDTPKHDDDGKMISLEDFIQFVTRACKPDAPPGLVEQMHVATHGMATQSNASPEIRALGRILNAILSGERNPNLSELPGNVVERIGQMLTELR